MLLLGDCNHWLKEIKDNSIDLIVTDPPYGIEFMGKDWDKALVQKETWKECYRVLKEGKLAFVMCSPRQDVLSRMIINLSDAGFRTNYTSIYWCFASGFPKALNMEKDLHKRYASESKAQLFNLWRTVFNQTERTLEDNNRRDLQKMLESLEQGTQHEIYAYTGSDGKESGISERQRESCLERWSLLQKEKGELSKCKVCKMPVGIYLNGKERRLCYGTQIDNGSVTWESIDENGVCSSYQSQHIGQSFRELDVICNQCITQKVRESGISGAYSGFQPKPALEIVLVVSKGRTKTWLDDCRIPYQSEDDKGAGWHKEDYGFGYREWSQRMGYDKVKKPLERGEPPNEKGRFPANLTCGTAIEYDINELLELQNELKTCK